MGDFSERALEWQIPTVLTEGNKLNFWDPSVNISIGIRRFFRKRKIVRLVDHVFCSFCVSNFGIPIL